jgi:hypothetical protein
VVTGSRRRRVRRPTGVCLAEDKAAASDSIAHAQGRARRRVFGVPFISALSTLPCCQKLLAYHDSCESLRALSRSRHA